MYPYLIYCADFYVHAICLWYLSNPKLDKKTLSASRMCLQGIAKKRVRDGNLKLYHPAFTYSCWMLAPINAIKHVVHWPTLFQILHPAWSWSSTISVQFITVFMKNCWFGLRKTCISQWSYNITHNMWCMRPGHIHGPHFFKGSSSAICYAEMLEGWSIPQPRDSGLLDYVWLQNNRSHIFCFSVYKTLNEHSVSC